ncbi:hypothetical protein HD598_000136 [Neomicrococcus aestuarii]|uniref:PqqD family protein n=1 Tax=Neomicrococcus aestuarii TaxID=556325 RepID=A0A7W8TR96_9MICC|nr:PqqD family protein [Neomicrococcus aestuarii]MBB5511449.1 hypothetical protein [Neomicrococcus aestuarii]
MSYLNYKISDATCFDWFVNENHEEAVVCSQPGNSEAVLIQTSASIWGTLSDSYQALDSIVAAVASNYELSATEVFNEVKSTLETLASHGLLDVSH